MLLPMRSAIYVDAKYDYEHASLPRLLIGDNTLFNKALYRIILVFCSDVSEILF